MRFKKKKEYKMHVCLSYVEDFTYVTVLFIFVHLIDNRLDIKYIYQPYK